MREILRRINGVDEPSLSVLKEDAASFDRLMFFCIFSLTCWGILCVYSAGAGTAGRGWSLACRQAGWLALSCGVMFAAFAAGHRRLLDAAYPIYGATLLLLLITALTAARVKGAQSWISIGVLRFQPSEFGKISLILVMSKFLSRCPPHSLKAFFAGLGVAAPAVLLVLIQPDTGSAIVYLVIVFGMMLTAGLPFLYIWVMTALGVMASPFMWMMLKEYQKMRLLVFLDPMRDPLGAGYNVIQSRIAVGSGGFWGKGFMNGMQSKLRFLPEPHTDFIFSVCSEEFGFLGACVMMLIFALLLFRIVKTGMRSRDMRCKIFSAGVTMWIWFQMFESIGMSIGLMPVTGLPLPFLSYGGSSLFSVFAALGIIWSIHVSNTRRHSYYSDAD